ncbi:TPA: hypothetical protein ACSPQ7_000587 [Pseudomonas aeruginosa]
MTKANECTCPSGDGSLRHPCPAHPASVELAGVAAKLTFINGRPAMCGCQVEYSSGGGEYSDVIYVTLCAKHSGSAILDLVATNRIALTPEYEGQWHADLYLDREIPLAKADGATPAEAVLALMSAERIDPEQESVEQAGGDERDLQGAQGERDGWGPFPIVQVPWNVFDRAVMWVEDRRRYGDDGTIVDDWKALKTIQRAALAQPSPKCATCNGTGQIVVSGPHYCGELQPPEYETEPCDMCSQPSPAQAEAERPEVVAWSNWKVGTRSHVPFRTEEEAARSVKASEIAATQEGPYSVEQLMTVAQHERITAQLHDALDESDGDRWKLRSERDAALANVDALAVQVLKLGGTISFAHHRTDQAGQVPQAWLDVQAERRRQVEAEGWTPEHDDEHSHGQMARAAACYALAGSSAPNDGTAALLVSLAWPWDEQWWKPSTARRDMVKACALGLAEIERLDRIAASQGGPSDA